MCSIKSYLPGFEHIQLSNKELIDLVKQFKKHNIINLADYAFGDLQFTLPFIDYARIYLSANAAEIAKTKNIDICKFVSKELNLVFMENLSRTEGKLNEMEREKVLQRSERLRRLSAQRTAFMPGPDDWYTGVRTVCTMIYLPDVEELPIYKTDIQTFWTQGRVKRVTVV